MKKKTIIALLAMSLTALSGCGSKESQDIVTLSPPSSSPQYKEEVPIEEDTSSEAVTEKELELKITSRTRIMVSDDGVISKTPTEPIDMDAVPTEEDSTLTRFKKNVDKISMPKNYKISGTAKSSSESDSTFTVCCMDSGEYYFFSNFDTVTLELYTENVNDVTKPVYVKAKNSSDEISGYVDTTTAASVEETKNDFRMTSIDSVVKNGNNYNVTGSYIWGGEQTDGMVTVSDNYTVYNIESDDGTTKTNMKIQTLLKMPATASDFDRTKQLTEDDLMSAIHGSFMDALSSGIESSNSSNIDSTVDVQETSYENYSVDGSLVSTVTVTFNDYGSYLNAIFVEKDTAGKIISSDSMEVKRINNDYCYHVNYRLDENINADELIVELSSLKSFTEITVQDNGVDADLWFTTRSPSRLLEIKEAANNTTAVVSDISWKEITR